MTAVRPEMRVADSEGRLGTSSSSISEGRRVRTGQQLPDPKP